MEMEKLESLLFGTAISALEDLGFLLPDESVSERQAAADLAATARVAFGGAADGCVTLRLCGGFLPEFTMNMLGEEEPPAPELQLDALGELTRVICGNLLPALAGRGAACELRAPIAGFGAIAPPAGERRSACTVSVADGRIELEVHTGTVPPGGESA